MFVIGAKGCYVGAKVVALVYANCLAYISIYALLDAVYVWLAGRVGFTTNIVVDITCGVTLSSDLIYIAPCFLNFKITINNLIIIRDCRNSIK